MLIVFGALRRKKLARKMLVLAKRRIIYKTWPDEIAKWGFDHKYAIVHGSQAKKLRALRSDADVFFMTYESLFWLYQQSPDIYAQFDVLVCDESSKIKNWSAKRSKLLRKHLTEFKYRYCLTGSLQPNTEMDIFMPTYALDLGQRLGTFITAYRNQWFFPSGFEGHDWKLRQDGAAEEIADKISDIWLRFGDEELDLPPLSFVTREVTLSDRARTIYDELENEFVAEIDAGIIVAPNAGVASGKMRQVTGGAIYTRPVMDGELAKSRPWELVDGEKLDELEDLLSDLNGLPLLVAYTYDHERQRLQDRIQIEVITDRRSGEILAPDEVTKRKPQTYLKKSIPVPCIGGGTPDAEANRLIDLWNVGALPCLLGQPQAIAHGLNLQGAHSAVCFFALGWNYEDHDQFIRRIWRQGQAYSVIVYYLVAADTIDADQIESLDAKGRRQDVLYEAIRKRNKKRKQKGPATMAKAKTETKAPTKGKAKPKTIKQMADEQRLAARLKVAEDRLAEKSDPKPKAKAKAKASKAKPKAKAKASKAKPKAKAKKAAAKSKEKAPTKTTGRKRKPTTATGGGTGQRLRIGEDYRVKRGKKKPDEGSLYEVLVKCVHPTGATTVAKLSAAFMAKPDVKMGDAFLKANPDKSKAKVAFTRAYVLRSIRREYLASANK